MINPVLYVEYEDTNWRTAALLEIVGHDSIADLAIPNAVARQEIEREMELKLILLEQFQRMEFFGEFHHRKGI